MLSTNPIELKTFLLDGYNNFIGRPVLCPQMSKPTRFSMSHFFPISTSGENDIGAFLFLMYLFLFIPFDFVVFSVNSFRRFCQSFGTK